MSITPDQIPPEAVEAATNALLRFKDPPGVNYWGAERTEAKARAAIAAALAAWPGVYTFDDEDDGGPPTRQALILPL